MTFFSNLESPDTGEEAQELNFEPSSSVSRNQALGKAINASRSARRVEFVFRGNSEDVMDQFNFQRELNNPDTLGQR